MGVGSPKGLSHNVASGDKGKDEGEQKEKRGGERVMKMDERRKGRGKNLEKEEGGSGHADGSSKRGREGPERLQRPEKGQETYARWSKLLP